MKVTPETRGMFIKVLIVSMPLVFCLRWFYLLYNTGKIEAAYSYLFYIPIVFGAFFYGIAGGFIVSLIAAVAYSIFISIESPCGLMELFGNVGSFVLIGLLSGVLSSSRKKAERELLNARDELEKRVEKRTVDLIVANKQLRETQDQLIQAEKLRAVGMLASGVAHEVKNPLAIIMQGTEFLEKNLVSSNGNVSRTLDMIKDSVGRADDIIKSLLDFSRLTDMVIRPEDINSVLESSLELVKQRLKFEHNIKITNDMKKSMPMVLIDKNRIQQVFVNILLNAVQAMPEGGEIVIRSYDMRLEKIRNGVGRRKQDNFKCGEKVVVAKIEDTGAGIPEEIRKKIFDPFFTTKGPRDGVGLGLSVSRRIINMHGGLVEVKSEPGSGTKVIITFKIAEEDRNGEEKDIAD